MTDAEKVAEYMQALEHPLKKEMEAVRSIIKGASEKLSERIKWKAPSYYYKQDLLTFNHRMQEAVHLIFHHIAIVDIESEILKGDYKDRRMVYFENMAAIETHKAELQRIIIELVAAMDR